MNLLIWGTGKTSQEYLSIGEIGEKDIVGFIESNKTKDTWNNKRVYAPDDLPEYDVIIVLICGKEKEIVNTCKEHGIDISKVVLLNNWKWRHYSNDLEYHASWVEKRIDCKIDVKMKFPKLYEKYIRKFDEFANRYIMVRKNAYDLVDNQSILDNHLDNREYREDYFRYKTFEYVARQIIKENVVGSVAELGVAYGNFAILINEMFPHKRLFLFDTFDSFVEDEFYNEVKEGNVSESFLGELKDINVKEVIRKLPHKDKCIIKKGVFPDTSVGLEDERFAFVSIDVDLKESILHGLEFFYPRLSEGGVIFVHDYHNNSFYGVKQAVLEYEMKNNIRLCKLPLADGGGTLAITV